MKYFNLTGLATALLACSIEASASAYSKEQLLGSWNCSLNIEEDRLKLLIEVESTYVRNGNSHTLGIVTAKFNERPEMTYSIATSSTWEVSESYLITTLKEAKVVNLTHPEFDNVLKLQDFFVKGTSDSSRILELTSSKLSVKSETDGTVYHCSKRLVKS